MRTAFRRARVPILLTLGLLKPVFASAFTDGGWVQHPADAQVSLYSGAVAALDTRRGRVIEIGGRRASYEHPQEIWSFDLRNASGWSSLGPAPAASTPNGLDFGAAAYDSLADCVYFFGGGRSGYGTGTYSSLSDTLWRLDLSQAPPSWNIVSVAPGPVGRKEHVLAFDAAGRQLILFGGRNSAGTALADFWTLDVDAPAWVRITAPGPRSRYFAAGSASNGRFVLLGGLSNYDAPMADTWLFDFAVDSWQNLGATDGPQGALTGVIDPARNRMLVLARSADSLACWQLSLGYATEWRRLATSGFTPPGSSQRFSAVYDPVSDCLVDVNGDFVTVGRGEDLRSVVVLHSLHFSPLPVVNVIPTTTVQHESGFSFMDLSITADRPLYGPIAVDRIDDGRVGRRRRILLDPDGHARVFLDQLSPGAHYDYRLAWFDGADVRSLPIPIDTPPAPVHLDVTVDSLRVWGQYLEVFWNVPNDSATWLAKVVAEYRINSGPWTSYYYTATWPVGGKLRYGMQYFTSRDTVSFHLRWGPTLTEYASEPATIISPVIPTVVATGGNRAAAIAEIRVDPESPFPTTLEFMGSAIRIEATGPVNPDGLLHFEDPNGAAREGSGRYFLMWRPNDGPSFLPLIDIVVSNQEVDLLHLSSVDSTAARFTWTDPEPDWSVPLVLERAEGAAVWDSLDVLPPGLATEKRTVVDATVLPVRDYRYRLRWPQQGLSYVHSLELAVTTPGTPPDTTESEPEPDFALAFGAVVANPMRGILALPVTTPAGEAATLELFDASGRRVHRRELAPSWSGTVSLEGLRGGMYFARLATATKVRLRKVVLLP